MSGIRNMLPWNTPSAVAVRRGDNGFSIAALQEEMNRLFEHFYNGMEVRMTDWDAALPTSPAINVTESPNAFKVEAALPGIEAKDVKVETVGGVLTISGERKEEKKEEKPGSYLRQEISYGSFMRSVTLPETADGGKAKAEFRNGVLTVTVPKKADAVQKPQKIEVKQAA
ncbi:MAG: Hsp20/alpha crystallin family protein [Alphaproteobacteria bacterium]|nr:MAG: Hsp20/alpha crystallin family protein [Alphaproteobacteria bacterium]